MIFLEGAREDEPWRLGGRGAGLAPRGGAPAGTLRGPRAPRGHLPLLRLELPGRGGQGGVAPAAELEDDLLAARAQHAEPKVDAQLDPGRDLAANLVQQVLQAGLDGVLAQHLGVLERDPRVVDVLDGLQLPLQDDLRVNPVPAGELLVQHEDRGLGAAGAGGQGELSEARQRGAAAQSQLAVNPLHGRHPGREVGVRRELGAHFPHPLGAGLRDAGQVVGHLDE